MKIENYQFPKSSFLSMDKDCGIIFNWMMKNNRLKKLLYYTTPDCLDRPNLTEEQSAELFGKNIKIVPIEKEIEKLKGNIDNIITFDIICHFDQWQLKDFELRPYKIAAEIDSMFNNKHLSGIGLLQFLGANQIILTDEFAGLTLMYQAVHRDDDTKNAPVGKTDKELKDNFNELFNNKNG